MSPVKAPSFGPELGVSVPIDTFIALGFFAMVIIYVIFTVILYYHWQTYSTDTAIQKVTLIAYFAISIPLIGIMGLATLALN